jgi:hypothetical protein
MLIPNSRIYKTIGDKKVVEVKSVNEVLWNKIETTFPSSAVDVFSYFMDNQLAMVVTVTYSGSNKKDIVLIEKEVFD